MAVKTRRSYWAETLIGKLTLGNASRRVIFGNFQVSLEQIRERHVTGLRLGLFFPDGDGGNGAFRLECSHCKALPL